MAVAAQGSSTRPAARRFAGHAVGPIPAATTCPWPPYLRRCLRSARPWRHRTRCRCHRDRRPQCRAAHPGCLAALDNRPAADRDPGHRQLPDPARCAEHQQQRGHHRQHQRPPAHAVAACGAVRHPAGGQPRRGRAARAAHRARPGDRPAAELARGPDPRQHRAGPAGDDVGDDEHALFRRAAASGPPGARLCRAAARADAPHRPGAWRGAARAARDHRRGLRPAAGHAEPGGAAVREGERGRGGPRHSL